MKTWMIMATGLFIALAASLIAYDRDRKGGDEYKKRHFIKSAYEHCKSEVAQELKSPTSAVYPESLPTSVIIDGGSTITMSFDVSSDNAFGASIRNKWLCKASCFNDRCFTQVLGRK